MNTGTKRHNPLTSKLAHESIKPSKEYMYVKIVAGLEKLRVGGNFEEVALASGIKPEQAWKRLSELVEKGICFNTGITHVTSSGRQAMVRQLTSLKSKIIIEPMLNKPNKVIQAELFS